MYFFKIQLFSKKKCLEEMEGENRQKENTQKIQKETEKRMLKEKTIDMLNFQFTKCTALL
jgi:hypothetical protein